MAEFESVGVRGSGVRLVRFEDGSLVRDIPGLFKIAFIAKPSPRFYFHFSDTAFYIVIV